ncbi:MAG: LamG domain-containing protein [Saccharofermentanales bacterium]
MKKLLSLITLITMTISMLTILPQNTTFAIGTTYYIDTAGNNSNNGTSTSTPWADFTNINSMNLSTGDQILLKRGCTWTATQSYWYFCAINGSSVTVDAYGTGASPKLDGNGFGGCGFYFLNRDNLKFQNITFANMTVLVQDTYTTFGHTGLTFKNIHLSNSSLAIVNHVDDTGETVLSDVNIDGLVSDDATGQYYGAVNINTILTTDTGMPSAPENSVSDIMINNIFMDGGRNVVLSLTSCQNAKISNVRINNCATDYLPQGTTSVFLWITKNLQFYNCIVTDTPNSFSNDQCAIDNEFHIDGNIYKGCFFAGNGGAGLEYLALADRPGDFSTGNVANNCTFADNGTAGTLQRGSIYRLDCSGVSPSFSGTASNNLFCENVSPGNGNDGLTQTHIDGNFTNWTFSNNKKIASADYIFNTGNKFSGTQGSSNWNYQTYNGSTWSNMSYDSSLGIYGSSSNSIGRFDMLPDATSSHWTARAFTAPAAGIVQIGGWAYMPYNNNGGDGAQVRITKNGSVIWGSSSISGTDAVGLAANVNDISVNEGDIIRFEVNCGNSSNNSYDQVSWIPTVAYSNFEVPVSEWKMSGNANDSIGSNNGTTSGGAAWAAGKSAQASSLDGTDDYINIADSVTLDSMSKLTVSAWINMSALPPANKSYLIVAKEDSNSGAYRICVGANGQGHVALATANNSWYTSGTTASWTTQMQTNTWYHIVATYDGSYVKIYINGTLESTGAQAISGNIVRYTQPLRIGYPTSSANINYFSGKIDEVRIYNIALGSTGVTRLYNSCPPYISEWKFDSNTNDSNTNNNASSSGTTSWTTGRKINALNLDGSSGYVNIPDSISLDSMRKLTVSAWINMSALPMAGKNYLIAAKEDNNGGAYRICVGSNGTGHIALATTNNSWYSSGTTASWTTQMQTNTWYHIAATYDGSYVKIYINGSLQGTGEQAISGSIVRYALPLRLGYPTSASFSYFNGKIDEVRIYDNSLDSTGVQSLYNSYPPYISEWKFEDNIKDTTGINNGAINGGSDWTTGKSGDAIKLFGINGVVNIADSTTLDNMSEMTISTWVKVSALPTSGKLYTIIGKEDVNSGAYRIMVSPDGTGHVAIATANNGWYTTGTTASWTTRMQINTWYHIVATYDGTRVRIYINGDLEGTGVQAISGNIVRYAQPLRIGYPTYSNVDYFNGIVDEVRIYSKALDSTEVDTLYNSY